MTDYTINDARYAKGKKLIVCSSDGSGFKTRTQALAQSVGGRYVKRSKGYMVSPAAAIKFERLYAAGFCANIRMFNDSEAASFYRLNDPYHNISIAAALKLCAAS